MLPDAAVARKLAVVDPVVAAPAIVNGIVCLSCQLAVGEAEQVVVATATSQRVAAGVAVELGHDSGTDDARRNDVVRSPRSIRSLLRLRIGQRTVLASTAIQPDDGIMLSDSSCARADSRSLVAVV